MDKRMVNLARLIVTQGVALKNDQPLYIKTGLEGLGLTREIARQAYSYGASQVEVEYIDNNLFQLSLRHDSLESLTSFPSWKGTRNHYFNERRAARVTILTPDPALLVGIDPARITAQQRAYLSGMKPFRDEERTLGLQWTTIAVPTTAWAGLVFPGLDEAASMSALWDVIYHCNYVDDSDIAEAGWQAHIAQLIAARDHLNQMDIRRLHFRSSLGTNLELELCTGAKFISGISTDWEGRSYCPNIPTEEVFSSPKCTAVNGYVKSTRPLSYAGTLIENISFTFRDGIVVDFSAEAGYDVLRGILETDSGSKMLGEVAFVPHSSPISQTGLLFYNTLFDENASCHLALGAGFPDVIDGEKMIVAERIACGLNDSTIHVDFMFGTTDMECIATDRVGNRIKIFENGNFKN